MEQMTGQPESQATTSAGEHSAPRTLSAEQVYACGRRLALLARKIDKFHGVQLQELERTWSELQRQAESHAAWEQMSRDLHQEQTEWEQKKAEQAERIAEELEFLAAAWDRIEAERRALLTRESDIPAAEPVVAAAPLTAPAVVAPPAPLNLTDFDSVATGRSAALQFQQIKREIRQHARRRS